MVPEASDLSPVQPQPPVRKLRRLGRQFQRARAYIYTHLTPARALFILAAITTLVWLLWWRCGLGGCPNVQRLTAYQPGGASILYDIKGKRFADLAPVDHEVVRFDSLPTFVPAAFVAVEDKRFYQHDGVDYRRVVGAALADLKAGRIVQGFSTITMQLARNVWTQRLPGQQRTLKRKVLEIRVAREIERVYDKNEILELYLNHIYFGQGAYGIEAASRNYFGKPARNLTLAQAAMLAAMPKSPTIYNPRRNAERVRARRNLVLSMMVTQGLVDEKEATRARDTRLSVRRESARRASPTDVAPFFADAVRRVLEERLGEDLYSSPLRIYTTMDPALQRAAEEELENQLRALEWGAFGRFTGTRYTRGKSMTDEPDYLQGAVVLMDARTGAVGALVGGRDFQQSEYDRATRARRQAGSAFKPFVYAAALEHGYVPSQHIADLPIRLALPGGEIWEPQNSEGGTEGAVSMRDALVRSRNLPTIRLAADVGVDEVISVARSSGIRSPLPDVPSLAIGTASVTPLEMTAAYSTFATLGHSVSPSLIVRVLDANDDVVWQPGVRRRAVMEPEVAYLVTDMLSDALRRGTGVAALRNGYHGPAAGKTGTTNDASDVWFVGYTPDLIGTVWIGFDRPRTIVADASGGRIAAPLWGRIMRRAYRNRAQPDAWQRPASVVRRRIDPSSGLILAAGCRPESGAPGAELFIAGSEPPASCPRGQRTEVDESLLQKTLSGLRAFWVRSQNWVRNLVKEEPKKTEPRERYLGVPRLPRAQELPVPEVDPRIVEPGWMKDTLPLRVPDLRLETLQMVIPDTLRRSDTIPLPRRDTIPPPRRDTVFSAALPLFPKANSGASQPW